MGSTEVAKQAYKVAVDLHTTAHKVGRGSYFDLECEKANSLGRNILHEELGRFGPWEGASYNLDDATRDRLIAHSRQDIAYTSALARLAFQEANGARMVASRLRRMLIFLIAINVLLLIIVLAR